MEIYADLFVLINCICDGLILSCTALLLKRRLPLLRLLIASLAGGCYALGYLLLYPAPWALFPLSLLTSLAMVLIAFGYHGHGVFLKSCFCFYLLSLVLGGAVGAIQSILLTYLISSQMGSLFILLALLLSLFLLCLWARSYLLKRKKTALLSLAVSGCRYQTKGLLDSGNLLKDPKSGRPVVLLDPLFLKERPFCDREIHVITVAGTKILPAFLPEKALIDGLPQKICIALCPPPENGYGNTPALLPPCP